MDDPQATTNDGSISYNALDVEHADADGFVIGSVRELVPDDVSTTPPVVAKMYFSESFTDDDDSERTYRIELDYPAGVENTVVEMTDVPTVNGSRLFRRFVDNMAETQGYDVDVVDITEYLEEREEGADGDERDD